MSAAAITPAGFTIGVAVAVALFAVLWVVLTRRRRPRSDRDDVVIDLTYLERAIRADEEAVTQRDADGKPLFSESSDQPSGRHRLPTEDR